MNEIAPNVASVGEAFAPIQYVPLGTLRVSPRNARKKPPTRIRELAEDIGVSGLLQNPVVHVIDGEPGQHGVCAGQRRLAALDLLKNEGRAKDSDLIPVRIVSEGEALATSLIENAEREGMLGGRPVVKEAGVSGAERFTPEKAKPLHGETLCERLTAHRTAAVQAELMKQPTVALAYLMFAMVPRVFSEQFEARATDALDAQFTPTHDRLLRVADDMADSPAWLFIDAERQKWRAMLPTKVRDLLPWLLSCSEDVLANLFAFCVAATVNGLSRWDQAHDVNTLAGTLALDMTAYWKPTRASYLNHVSKQRILDVVTQAVSAEAAAPLASMKKGDAAAAAELRLADSGWLPEVLTNRETPASWEDDEADEETQDAA